MDGVEDISVEGDPESSNYVDCISNDGVGSEPDIQNQPGEEGKTVIAFEEAFWKTDQPAGSLCYAIPVEWWKRWCDYTGFTLENKQASIQVC